MYHTLRAFLFHYQLTSIYFINYLVAATCISAALKNKLKIKITDILSNIFSKQKLSYKQILS